jgi:hypothetical protein
MSLWLRQLNMSEIVKEIFNTKLFPQDPEPQMGLPIVKMLAQLGKAGIAKVLSDGCLIMKLGELLHHDMEKLHQWQQNSTKDGNPKFQHVPTLNYGDVGGMGLESTLPSLQLGHPGLLASDACRGRNMLPFPTVHTRLKCARPHAKEASPSSPAVAGA